MNTRILYVLLCVSAALAACSSERGIPLNGPPPLGPALSWTAAFVQGTQTGPITFQAVGQTATLYASPQPNGTRPPYRVLLEGSCVALSSSSFSTSVRVTAAASGTCNILIGGSATQASVP
jgi:hypothetical protein